MNLIQEIPCDMIIAIFSLLTSKERADICSVSKWFNLTIVSVSRSLSLYPSLYDLKLRPVINGRKVMSTHSAITRRELFRHIKGRKAIRKLVMNIDYHLFVRLKHPLLVRPLFVCRGVNIDQDVLRLTLAKKPVNIHYAFYEAYHYNNVRGMYTLCELRGNIRISIPGWYYGDHNFGFGLGCKLRDIQIMTYMKNKGARTCVHCGLSTDSHDGL